LALVCLGIVALTSTAGCSREQAIPCPGQFDPSGLSAVELKREGISKIPEQEATTREHVTKTIDQQHGWIERNYEAVVDVGIGDGWGVAFTRDQYGNITYHRGRDYLILTTVETKDDCPDPDRGTLLIFGTEGLRVPVRFAYRST